MAMTTGKRRLILLGLAFGVAMFASYMVKVYLNQKAAELEAKYATGPVEKISVVVARRNVPSDTRVTLDDFAVRQIQADMVPPDAILPSDIERALGQSLRVNLPLGRPLLWAYLSSGTNPSFSDMLEEDRRALTIAVDELNSISGMIRPYDRIDLFIVTKEKPATPIPGRRDSKVVKPLLQDVLVKATGNIVRRETSTDGREYDRRYSTLTLDLLPEEIGRVLIAQENGELKAALKRPEQSTAHYLPTRESDLWGETEEGATEGGIEGVTFYIGGGRGKGVIPAQLQPYSKDVITGGAGTTGSFPMEIPDDLIGGPMSQQQIELIEQHMKRYREADEANARAAGSVSLQLTGASSAERQ